MLVCLYCKYNAFILFLYFIIKEIVLKMSINILLAFNINTSYQYISIIHSMLLKLFNDFYKRNL